MEIVLGRIRAQLDSPPTQKFRWPLLVIPELFASRRHLALLVGYLASMGWEVYALDFHDIVADPANANARRGFEAKLQLLANALTALRRDVIIVGHGMGGLLALRMAEDVRVKATVAFAPLLPGFRSPLYAATRSPFARLTRRSSGLPALRTLAKLVEDADAFQREALIKALIPEDLTAARDVARGALEFDRRSAAPRLIVCGDCDIFAPYDRVTRFAAAIGATLSTIPGRGHWLIGGRALERAVAEMQRFLVRSLGQQLLLLYPDSLDGSDEEANEDSK
jgi:pimeloyl-ACP methyl ester carboxylesterase